MTIRGKLLLLSSKETYRYWKKIIQYMSLYNIITTQDKTRKKRRATNALQNVTNLMYLEEENYRDIIMNLTEDYIRFMSL
jgi:hypothetical protein